MLLASNVAVLLFGRHVELLLKKRPNAMSLLSAMPQQSAENCPCLCARSVTRQPLKAKSDTVSMNRIAMHASVTQKGHIPPNKSMTNTLTKRASAIIVGNLWHGGNIMSIIHSHWREKAQGMILTRS